MITAARVLAAVTASAVIVACGAPATGPGDVGPTGTPGVTEGPAAPGGTPTTPSDAPVTDDAQDPDAPQGDALTEGDDAAAPAAPTPVEDLGPVGANGRAMLRGDRPRLALEIDVQEGAEPDRAAIEHLVATIAQHADKPAGITLTGGNTFASDRTEWTAADLRDAAGTHRSTASGPEVVSLYVLYVRGAFVSDGEETTAIGVAHRASEMALFPDRWRGLDAVLDGGRRIEQAVLVHEFGHLLGLVELIYDSDHDREDAEHPGHSSDRSSVMHWAVETTLIGQVFNGPPPDTFAPADVDDIAALREGR